MMGVWDQWLPPPRLPNKRITDVESIEKVEKAEAVEPTPCEVSEGVRSEKDHEAVKAPKKVFDRVGYQREYMRRRRADAKKNRAG